MRRATFIAYLAVVAVLLLLGAVNFYQKISWQTLTDSIVWSSDLRVIESPYPEVQPGDQLIEVGGDPVSSISQLKRALKLYEEGEGVVYRIKKKTGEEQLFFVVLKKKYTPLIYFLMAVVGFFTLFTGVYIAIRLRKNPETALKFLVLTTLLYSIYVFSPLGEGTVLDFTFFAINEVATWLFPPYFLYFFTRFPKDLRISAKTKVAIFALPVAMLLSEVVFYLLSSKLSLSLLTLFYRYLKLVQIGLIGLYAVAVLGLLVSQFLKEKEEVRAQIKWVLVGIVAGFFPFVVFYILPFIFGKKPGPLGEMTVIFHALLPLSFVYSLTKYRLPDVDVIIKKGLAFALSFIVTSGIFLIFAAQVFPEERRAVGVLSIISAVLVTIFLFPPLYSRMNQLLDRVFYRRAFQYRRDLMEISSDIAADRDWRSIEEKLVRRICNALRVEKLAFYAYNGEYYELIGHLGGRVSFRKMESPAILPGFVYLWRFSRKGTTLGFLLLGPKKDGGFFTVEDLQLLEIISPSIALALENALLYQQLSKRAAQLKDLKDFNESIIESLRIGILVTDEKGNIIKENSEIKEIFSPEGIEKVIKPLVKEILAMNLSEPIERWLPDRSGNRRLFSISCYHFRKTKGRIITLEDLTEKFMLQQRLLTAEKLASLGVLAAGIAHEINTPITGISSYLEMLKDRVADADTLEYIERMEKQIERIIRTVRGLMRFVKRSGEGFVETDLVDIIKDVQMVLAHQLKKARIEVKVKGEEAKAYVNPDRMQQVFFNLFSNAIDALKGKGGRIDIEVKREDGGVRIIFADNGPGIREDALAKIFDPFFSTKPDGLGLGLSITYGIIKEHGGEIFVDSELNRGTRFEIWLPRRRENEGKDIADRR